MTRGRIIDFTREYFSSRLVPARRWSKILTIPSQTDNSSSAFQMHVLKETQTSSKIKGTQAGTDEALMEEEQIRPGKRG
ncbi:hypothetical protein SAMN05660653_01158 [Desulfonatronum thiosulfatophilum]|uniref:Fic/DOC N-terminal domain-containing protein n=1 Tax=Desulfonatronum thiosulfatophilum TaxID=617002 RepID=A0A1G6BVR4_9BACT|nr:hypothetical protein SAMN05660653_01158 [Desulfonatronum thiosulfatophilum]